jgi:hypothetical protein
MWDGKCWWQVMKMDNPNPLLWKWRLIEEDLSRSTISLPDDGSWVLVNDSYHYIGGLDPKYGNGTRSHIIYSLTNNKWQTLTPPFTSIGTSKRVIDNQYM